MRESDEHYKSFENHDLGGKAEKIWVIFAGGSLRGVLVLKYGTEAAGTRRA